MMWEVSEEYAKYSEEIANKMWEGCLNIVGALKNMDEVIAQAENIVTYMGTLGFEERILSPDGDSETYRAIANILWDVEILKRELIKINDAYRAHQNLHSMIGANKEVSVKDVNDVIFRRW